MIWPLGTSIGWSQNSVGLLSLNEVLSEDGYNLIYPHNQSTAYLINQCGEVVHTWTDSDEFRPGNTCYISENGNLIKTKRRFDATVNDPIWAGGGGATVDVRTWSNDLLAQFTLNDSMARLHHDITETDDGNILMVAWEFKSFDEAVEAGRNPDLLANEVLWPEMVLEWDPFIDSIVWRWYAWDHLVQEFDSTKNNYGIVADHPELIDINYDEHDGHQDWLHINAIDYNPVLDQIMLSVPYFNEIWIIDHSTSTDEASDHSGGNSGRGGDLLYRWGNPQTYNAGFQEDQRLFFQHSSQWVDPWAEPNDPRFSLIQVFNNRVGPDMSDGNVWRADFDQDTHSYKMDDSNRYLPNQFMQTFFHPERPIIAASTGLSSAQLLQNGNMLMCAGRWGYAYELTPDNEVVWEYRTPIKMGQPATQGDSLAVNNNLTFRMDRYPVDFVAFEGRDLSPKGYIEENANAEFCDMLVDTEELFLEERIQIYPNPATEMIRIVSDQLKKARYNIYDLAGKKVKFGMLDNGATDIDVSSLRPGVYLLQTANLGIRKLVIQ